MGGLSLAPCLGRVLAKLLVLAFGLPPAPRLLLTLAGEIVYLGRQYVQLHSPTPCIAVGNRHLGRILRVTNFSSRNVADDDRLARHRSLPCWKKVPITRGNWRVVLIKKEGPRITPRPLRITTSLI